MKKFPSLLSALALACATCVFANAQDIAVTSVATSVSKNAAIEKTAYDVLGKADYECIYDYTIHSKTSKEKEFTESADMILQISPSMAKFIDYAAFHIDSTAANGVPQGLEESLNRAKINFTGEVLQNYPAGKITYTDIVTPSYVQYTENLAPFDWTIQPDTATVCGYLCTLATCSYGGRDWQAWFAEEIPSMFGPWKFSGLPGLILKVADTEGVHTMTAKSFRRADADPILNKPNIQTLKTSRDKFVKMKNEFEKNPMESIMLESITDITVSHSGSMLINGVPLPKRENGYTPIELK